MAMVTFTHPSKTNLEKNNHNLRDASFSAYLNSAKQAFVFKLVEPNQNFSPFITNPHDNFYLGRNKVEDEELGIFNADRYFNGGMDTESPRNTKSTKKFECDDNKDEQSDLVPVKTKIHPGTLSVHSESSWNSQTAFLVKSTLRNPNPPRRKTKKVLSKSVITTLGCNYCFCNDKNSIDIDEHVSDKNSSKGVSCGKIQEPIKNGPSKVDLAPNIELGLGLNKEENCSFPLLNSKKLKEEEDGKPRKSLEVFGSPILEKGKKTLSLERKFTMLNWDSTPRVEEKEISPNSEEMFNDSESDASSDLFEIESFTNNVTPRTCYAPSEASIEWSVVTASSAVSDSDELRKIATTAITTKMANLNRTVRNQKTQPIKEIQKKRSSLLGCKSQKAVRVAGDAHITSEKAVNDPRKCHGSMTRFQDETNVTGFDSGIRRQAFNAHSISRAHSATASRLLYIQ